MLLHHKYEAIIKSKECGHSVRPNLKMKIKTEIYMIHHFKKCTAEYLGQLESNWVSCLLVETVIEISLDIFRFRPMHISWNCWRKTPILRSSLLYNTKVFLKHGQLNAMVSYQLLEFALYCERNEFVSYF